MKYHHIIELCELWGNKEPIRTQIVLSVLFSYTEGGNTATFLTNSSGTRDTFTFTRHFLYPPRRRTSGTPRSSKNINRHKIK
jgi:hypothetical protein